MPAGATCGVCDSKLCGTSTRAPVVCPDPECQFVACRACARRYAIEGDIPRPACMAAECSTEYSDDVLAALLGCTWVSGAYRRHRSEVLLEGELSQLPDAMNDVPRFLEAEEATRQEEAAKAEVARARAVLRDAQSRYAAAQRRSIEAREPWDGVRAQHQYPCPLGECRGFVGPGWECCVCRGKTCATCLAPDHDGDACAEDAVASAAALRSVSKACPGCACPTERVSGCPQMYCTRCGCRWNWTTHQIHTGGGFHNPHLMAESVAGRANRGDRSLTFAQIRIINGTVRQALLPMARACDIAAPGISRSETARVAAAIVGGTAVIPESAQRFVALLLSHASSVGEPGPDDVRLLSMRLAARGRLGQMNKLPGRASDLGRGLARSYMPHAIRALRRRKRVEYALGRFSREDYRKWLQKNELERELNTRAGQLLERLSVELSGPLRRAYESLQERHRWTAAVSDALDGDESGLTVLVDHLGRWMGAAQAAVDSYNAAAGLMSARLGRSVPTVHLGTYEIKPQRTTQAQAAELSQALATAGAAESRPSPA
jgi:hypothetical protein